MAHAEAGRHCTAQSITTPRAGRPGLMHLSHFKAYVALRLVCLSLTCCTIWGQPPHPLL
jgi:hypothetical protein